MDRINGADTVDIGAGRRGFRSENLVSGIAGTEVTDTFLNGVQEEILKVIVEAGLVPDNADWSQLWKALQLLGLSGAAKNRRWTAVISKTLSSAPGAPMAGDTYVVPAAATGIWATHVGQLAEWSGTAWSYATPADGHGIGLPDGTIFIRIGGVYVELTASPTQKGLVRTATLEETKAGTGSGAVLSSVLGSAMTSILGAQKSFFNFKSVIHSARTSLSATGYTDFVTSTGLAAPYTKKSSTSLLMVRFQAFGCVSGSQGASIMRLFVGAQTFDTLFTNSTSSLTGQGSNSTGVFADIPAGDVPWKIQMGSASASAWGTVMNPRTSDLSYLPPITSTIINFQEVEP